MAEAYQLSHSGRDVTIVDQALTSDALVVWRAAVDGQLLGQFTVPADQRQAAAQALAGDGYRVVPSDGHSRLARENDDLRKQLHDAEVQAARPEPVDPADGIDTSDIVVTQDGNRLTVGDGAEACWAHLEDNPNWHYNHALNALALYRELKRRAEPQPDLEQVEAVGALLAAVDADLGMHNVISPDKYARELVRRGVVVRDV